MCQSFFLAGPQATLPPVLGQAFECAETITLHRASIMYGLYRSRTTGWSVARKPEECVKGLRDVILL